VVRSGRVDSEVVEAGDIVKLVMVSGTWGESGWKKTGLLGKFLPERGYKVKTERVSYCFDVVVAAAAE